MYNKGHKVNDMNRQGRQNKVSHDICPIVIKKYRIRAKNKYSNATQEPTQQRTEKFTQQLK
jgi:hypothetical protein